MTFVEKMIVRRDTLNEIKSYLEALRRLECDSAELALRTALEAIEARLLETESALYESR